MKRFVNAAQNFLDIEAEVDRDEEEEEEEEEEDDDLDFIHDEEDPAESVSRSYLSWNDLQKDTDLLNEGALNDFLQELQSLTRDRRHQTETTFCTGIGDNDDEPYSISQRPNNDDYPLWQIRCRLGLEEEAVFFLLQKATHKHLIRSAFTRGSVRGRIYVEARMTEDLSRLLRWTPGIVRTRQGLVKHQIDISDWTQLLTMSNPDSILKLGSWVRVKKGIYNGDAALVVDIKHWGVDVLLLPRLKPLVRDSDNPRKRKRSAIAPTPSLFDPVDYRNTYGIDPKRLCEGFYSVGNLLFEHGLLRKGYDFHSLSSTAVDMPSNYFNLYETSNHPSIQSSAFPRPREWIFDVGERVFVRSGDKGGIISSIGNDYLEVDFGVENGGTKAVSWRYMRKDLHVGDFVKVMTGEDAGKTGWVDWIMDDYVGILDKTTEGDDITDTTMKTYTFHVNYLKVTDVPFQHASNPSSAGSNTHISGTDYVPWIGTHVIITKSGHPLKGSCWVVTNVLRGQGTNTGLKVEMQSATYNPLLPFHRSVVDYDDVVEFSTRQKLGDYRKASGSLFQPLQSQLFAEAPSLPTSSTPIWEPSSLTPRSSLSRAAAWDPSSRTPLPSLGSPRATSSSATPSQQEETEHLLLSPHLFGRSLKVIANGGSYTNKEMVVTIVNVNGRPSIQRSHYKASASLEPDWVAPKVPNAKRDNGLLVVIKGEHCGKYVRRIHHRSDNGQDLVNLAVMTKVDGLADALSGEQFELGIDSLCVGHETKEEKSMNEKIMQSLREKARQSSR